MSFNSDLITRRIGQHHIELQQDLTFYWQRSYGWGVWDRTTVVAPSGFVCDGASVPFLLRWLAGHPFGDMLRSAVTHDFLYRTQSMNRSDADRVMLQAMRVEGVGVLRRTLVYVALRLFGGRAYRTGPERL